MSTSILIVGYLALFITIGLGFVFVNLLLGRFLRPHAPNTEKLEIYECGEPTIGSSFVQFDLRFYVIALVFIIFDVEVAFLFPWATLFGKVNHLQKEAETAIVMEADEETLAYSKQAASLYREIGIREATPSTVVPPSMQEAFDEEVGESASAKKKAEWIETKGLNRLNLLAAFGVAIFFVILLIGLAYEWATGALDWVRALTEEHQAAARRNTTNK